MQEVTAAACVSQTINNWYLLHLPKQFCELPLFGFPENFPKYPTKRQFISYVESYAEHFSIAPMFNQEVERAEFDHGNGVWRVQTQDCEYISRWLIVATGENAEPSVPEIQGIERFEGTMVHTSLYKSGSEFTNHRVLVVGCGYSGMEVSLDLCRHKASPHVVVRSTVSSFYCFQFQVHLFCVFSFSFYFLFFLRSILLSGYSLKTFLGS